MTAQAHLGAPALLGPSAVLAVTAKGLRLPATGERRSVRLPAGGADLLLELAAGRLLSSDEAVAAVAVRRDVDAEPLRALVAELADRGALGRTATFDDVVDEPIPPRAVVGVEADDAEPLVAKLPILLRPHPDGFDFVGHDGSIVLRMTEPDLDTLLAFATPAPISAAIDAADPDQLRIVGELRAAGLLAPFDAERSPQARAEREMQAVGASISGLITSLRADLARREEDEARRAAETGITRTRVVPVVVQPGLAPLSLGMVLAYAEAHDDGALNEWFHFLPNWYLEDRELERYAEAPAIYLFSNYVWSSKGNHERSRTVKSASAANVTIHGGPDTPRRAPDVEAYFAEHPHVDIAVHGEGEITTAELLHRLGSTRRPDGTFDLSTLRDVPGLSFRDGDQVVRTPDRDRQADLDVLPSPYLAGTFEAYANGNATAAIIETNRGCPYGCTFCDWGSATLSRIRKFDLDRVFAEMEWCARAKVPRIFIADANFGIFERDVAIAEKLAELKREYGYPRAFGTNYAKNTVKHLKKIVQVMVEADVLTEGLLSLQTMDEGTLSTIKRSNIKTDKYDQLAREFRAAGLPLFVDIMLGLPGSTTDSFRSDLQECVEREVTAKIFQTEVLVNSPMNEPAYRELHQIKTAPAGDRLYDTRVDETSSSSRALVVSTASFTRDDYAEMIDLRRAFRLFENFGVLRQVTRFVRQAAGIKEADLIDQLRRASKDPVNWPYLALGLDVVPEVMVPPISWRLFLDEVRRYLVTVVGIEDEALDTVLAVQLAILPARGRTFPASIQLDHDYAAWHRQVIEAKEARVEDWTSVVPPLRTFGPASFVVDDPVDMCGTGLGFRNEDDFYGDWELRSPVSRAMPALHKVFE